jgi:hypothetical protein
MEAQVICTIKFADDLLLLPKEETVEQHMEKLFGLEDTVEWKRLWKKTKVRRISRSLSPAQIMIGQQQLVNVE